MIIPNTVSPQGISLIKRFEGCHKKGKDGNYKAYRCIAGKWTIGYGHTYGVRSGMTCTPEECDSFLNEDMNKAGAQIRQVVNVPLSQSQFDAIVSFVFNLGIGNFKSSTLLKKLNKGEYNSVPAELMKWNKARVDGILTELSGLTRRRAAEASLWALDNDLGESEPIMPQRPEAAAVKPLAKSKTMAGAGLAGTAGMCSEIATQLESFISYSDVLKYAFLALSLAGIVLVAYSRINDHKEGIH